MSQFLIKNIKAGIWILIPLLFTSYISPRKIFEETVKLEGSYDLRTTGKSNLELTGEIDFETTIETSNNGIPFSTLKLNLKNNKKEVVHSLGFLISEQNNSSQLKQGTYKVSRKIEGFLNCFDGVFGFANIKVLGELPFFARKGKITILQINDRRLRGNIDITMESPNGKQIHITGNFTAAKTREE